MLISRDVIHSLIKECTNKKDLVAARHAHSLLVSNGLDSVTSLGDQLIRLFALFGELLEANLIFCNVVRPSIYTFDAIISAHAMLGENKRVIELFHHMQQYDIKPDKFICVCILKACGTLGAVGHGKEIHDQMTRIGIDSDVIVTSTLVDMYCKFGSIDEAHKVFAEMPDRDVVAWGAIIAGYAQHGHGLSALEFFGKMLLEGIKPDKITVLCVLKACSNIGALDQGKLIHDIAVRNGVESNVVVGSALVDMYAKCCNLEEAQRVFDRLSNRNVIVWGSVIAGYAQLGDGILALELYEKMYREGIKPDRVIYLCILTACGRVGAIAQGELVHNQVITSGLESDMAIKNALLDMYAKCGRLEVARRLFDELLTRDVVSWNSLIAGYSQHGYGLFALELFAKMQLERIVPDEVTMSSVLTACGSIGAVRQGKSIHDQILGTRLGSDVVIGSSLVDMYAKCGMIEEARRVFDRLAYQNLVSWNAMISGYLQCENCLSALELFENMHLKNVKPDRVTFLCILKACGSIGAIGQGKLIHKQIIKSELHDDLVIGSTLVDMYAKCGSLEEACKLFDGLQDRDVVLWSSMIAAYAQHGNWRLAGMCLQEMQKQGLKPIDTTYTSILAACSHAGQVEAGQQYFNSMTVQLKVAPKVDHVNCMVDLLGRAGHLNKAEEVLQKLSPAANLTGWISLLTACRTYGNMEIARKCFHQLCLSDLNIPVGFMLMSNIFADVQMWETVEKIQELRKSAGAWKKAGVAWIEVDNDVHEFIVGDHKYLESDKICVKFDRVTKALKNGGYVPQLDLVFNKNEEVVLFS